MADSLTDRRAAVALTDRLATIDARIAAACRRAGRDRSEVRLVAVSKGVEPSAIRAAADAGVHVFGENYVQEWTAKRAALADRDDLAWHFIGRVQRNKAAAIAESALVHSLADERVATALDAVGALRKRPVRALVQVNLTGEATKAGVAPQALGELLAGLHRRSWLRVDGLMLIPPIVAAEDGRALFRELRALRDRQQQAADLRELSMGMSEDFETAIEEGATLIRIGTAIFGPRKGTT